MKHNIGRGERMLRLVLGSLLVIAGWGALWDLGITILPFILIPGGAFLLVTGILTFCPLNVVFGHNSCRECRNGVTEKHIPV